MLDGPVRPAAHFARMDPLRRAKVRAPAQLRARTVLVELAVLVLRVVVAAALASEETVS